MEIAVHHHHMCSDQAVVPDANVFGGHERATVIDEDVVADIQIAGFDADELQPGHVRHQADAIAERHAPLIHDLWPPPPCYPRAESIGMPPSDAGGRPGPVDT